MGLFDTLSRWFEAPYTELYRCSNCGNLCRQLESSCPECGGEVDDEEPPELFVNYWGPI